MVAEISMNVGRSMARGTKNYCMGRTSVGQECVLSTGMESNTRLRYEMRLMQCTVGWGWDSESWCHCSRLLYNVGLLNENYCKRVFLLYNRGDNDMLHVIKEVYFGMIRRDAGVGEQKFTMQLAKLLRQRGFRD